MSDIIRLLPDSVANQIAAGEVIQRPASVVKELMENAIDAGADDIIVVIKDAGRTLIQVSDNGKGMSETDARMAFERHATSKIKTADDLFSIQTMGFRGEALASIAAVADVELKTALADSEIGTYINIKGSEIVKQEPVSGTKGTSFYVKNLFFNVPARRKFLKKNSTEFKYIELEFQKVALAHPEKSLTLKHDDKVIYKLFDSNLSARILSIFPSTLRAKDLVPVKSETEFLKIHGFIGKPNVGKKNNKEQFFFVNNRYMKHSFFYRAVLSAYEQIMNPDKHPSYFIYFEIDPDKIDINIHPAKIEINFDDSHGVFSILRATVKESLGKHNVAPSIDFDRDGDIMLAYFNKNKEVSEPLIDIDKNYNPFDNQNSNTGSNGNYSKKDQNLDEWERLYKSFQEEENQQEYEEQEIFTEFDEEDYNTAFQIRNKYIVTPVKSGLMLISQNRAGERIIFEKTLYANSENKMPSQKLAYGQKIKLHKDHIQKLKDMNQYLMQIGFDINYTSDEQVELEGIPANIQPEGANFFIEDLFSHFSDEEGDIIEYMKEKMATSIAKTGAMKYNRRLQKEEITKLINELFSCRFPNYSPSGKPIISILEHSEIDNYFKQ